MSNPFGIPDNSNRDYDYSKLSPMLGMIDNDAPDYIGGATQQRKWNERLTHNCAVLYLGGSLLLFVGHVQVWLLVERMERWRAFANRPAPLSESASTVC